MQTGILLGAAPPYGNRDWKFGIRGSDTIPAPATATNPGENSLQKNQEFSAGLSFPRSGEES